VTKVTFNGSNELIVACMFEYFVIALVLISLNFLAVIVGFGSALLLMKLCIYIPFVYRV